MMKSKKEPFLIQNLIDFSIDLENRPFSPFSSIFEPILKCNSNQQCLDRFIRLTCHSAYSDILFIWSTFIALMRYWELFEKTESVAPGQHFILDSFNFRYGTDILVFC